VENYKHILLAIDLHPEGLAGIIEQGVKLAKEHNAKITLLHVVEHLNAYGVAQAYPSVLEVEEQLVKEAKEKLAKFKKQYQIEDADSVVEAGSPKMIILDYAKEHNVDLIALGSHGRHGIQLLLGSTANAVLHHAACDVLAIRIKK
jgi:universal stress protein A